MTEFATQLQDHRQPFQLELQLYSKDGTIKDVEVVVGLLLDDGGHVTGIRGNTRDITYRKQADKALRENEQLLRLITDNVYDTIWLMDLGMHPTWISPSITRTRGYTLAEMAEMPVDGHLTPESNARANELMAANLTPERIADPDAKIDMSGEFEVCCKDGSSLWMDLVVSMLRDYDGKPSGFLGVGRDISERRRHEEEKARLTDQLQQEMKMKAVGRLAGGVAHDFNNLLTGIIGNISMALIDLNPKDPLAKTLVEVEKAAESAAYLTRQLLAFSRKQIIEPKVLCPNDVITNIYRMLVRLIGENIEIKTIHADDLGAVYADPGQVEQILINLAANARDAMPHGGRLVIETANVRLDEGYCRLHEQVQPGSYVMLAVSDSGEGMSEEVKEHLFEPFFTTKPKGRGTGLGLATIYGAISQSGGSIEVDTNVGKGTTFKVYLPMITEKASATRRQRRTAAMPGGTETILVVEDEEIVRQLVVKILSHLGYTVLHAPDGEKALLIAAEHKDRIDLLITDVVMPGMNGRQLMEKLIKQRGEMTVLFTSGYTEDIILNQGVVEGNLNFIGKPYSPHSMANKVRGLLDNKKGG
ncbi:MAG: PAS domain S-box protein [Myxococcota bacterium]